jgi:hypothetical protein
MPLSSWLKGSPSQSLDPTSPNDFASLVNKMNLATIKADNENTYKAKYERLRKQIEQDKVYTELQAEITSLQNSKASYESNLCDSDSAKTSLDMQLLAANLVLKDTNVYYKAQLSTKEAQNKALKQENKKLKKDEQYLRHLLLSHGIQLPERSTTHGYMQTPGAESVPELTDDSDMDAGDEYEESDGGDEAGVCPQWYNYGTCSRGGGGALDTCEFGAHPRLVDFRMPPEY